MVKRLHHINFLVNDLEAALPSFCTLLGMPKPPTEELPQRGVRLARFLLEKTWLILVQPVDPNGLPAKYMAQHGEGFFLASLQVQNVQQSAQNLSRDGLDFRDKTARRGLDDWQLMDLEPSGFNGIELQLVQSEIAD